MKRILSVSVVGVFVSAVAVTAAIAAAPPRLQGTFHTKVTVTENKNFPGFHVGETKTRTYSFKPKCATGACPTVLRRQTLSSGFTKMTLKPAGASKYTGKVVGTEDCVNNHNKVEAKNAYRATLTLTLHVTGSSGGLVTAFSGTGKAVISRLPGAPSRCAPASQAFSVKSISH